MEAEKSTPKSHRSQFPSPGKAYYSPSRSLSLLLSLSLSGGLSDEYGLEWLPATPRVLKLTQTASHMCMHDVSCLCTSVGASIWVCCHISQGGGMKTQCQIISR